MKAATATTIPLILYILAALAVTMSQAQLLDGIYCGKSNCYDVLGVTREATKNEIAKNYRKLAKQFHPDLHREREAKKVAEEQFKIIANAYEILKDDESRTDYDYMLDNPDEYYAHYYRYYRRRMAPKVDVRVVIIVTISIISLVQYYSGWQRYESAIKYFLTMPKYRNRALDIAKQDGLLPDNSSNNRTSAATARNRKNKPSKDEIEQILKKVIEEKMDIKGAYAKPTIADILWIQLALAPYTVAKYIYWNVSWTVRHTVLKRAYSDDEKLYIIRRHMKMGQHQFDSQEDHKKDEYLRRELWRRDKFDVWFKEEEEAAKKQLAENSRYKQYRRYLKNHGVGRMTFDDS